MVIGVAESTPLKLNRLNPKKLLHSKWTAANPVNREKHFLVTEVEFDEQGLVIHCLIEAIRTRRTSAISWRSLKNQEDWRMGWH